tara:strand:+ start:1291 stop:1734 length:444 start_codon:yes stop_codon:yes gene_type:complete
MNQENKNVKFDPNLPVEVELTFDEPKSGISQYKNEDGSDKYWYLYGIKNTINGESGFFATPILHDIIKNTGAKTGTKLTITKVVKDEKTTWDVKSAGGSEPIQSVSIEDVPKIIDKVDIKDINNENNSSLEERVDKLERQVYILQNK